MYAVVNSGGKQYKVQKGDILRVERMDGQVGDTVDFDRVLMFNDGEDVRIGQPLLEDVKVRGEIVAQDKSKKILVFKYKRRKGYRRTQGHRQPFTAVRIDRIGPDGPSAEAAPAPEGDVEISTKPEPTEE
ncbi:MAG: 50S ribosomal protein L21 [Desulfococcaceae bacterium]